MKISSRQIITTLFCVYIAAVIFLCFMKGDGLPEVQFTLFGIPTDKLAHFCMFAPYPVLAFLTFRPEVMSKGRCVLLLLVLAVSGAGLAYGTEQLQGLTDYRSYEIADFYADLTGLGCGFIATMILILVQRR